MAGGVPGRGAVTQKMVFVVITESLSRSQLQTGDIFKVPQGFPSKGPTKLAQQTENSQKSKLRQTVKQTLTKFEVGRFAAFYYWGCVLGREL